MPEKENTPRIYCTVSPEIHTAVKIHTAKNGVSVQEWLLGLIKNEIKKKSPELVKNISD